MNNKIQQFKQLVDESNNIVFLEEREYLLKVEFLILEVKMGYTISNINIHQK